MSEKYSTILHQFVSDKYHNHFYRKKEELVVILHDDKNVCAVAQKHAGIGVASAIVSGIIGFFNYSDTSLVCGIGAGG